MEKCKTLHTILVAEFKLFLMIFIIIIVVVIVRECHHSKAQFSKLLAITTNVSSDSSWNLHGWKLIAKLRMSVEKNKVRNEVSVENWNWNFFPTRLYTEKYRARTTILLPHIISTMEFHSFQFHYYAAISAAELDILSPHPFLHSALFFALFSVFVCRPNGEKFWAERTQQSFGCA